VPYAHLLDCGVTLVLFENRHILNVTILGPELPPSKQIYGQTIVTTPDSKGLILTAYEYLYQLKCDLGNFCQWNEMSQTFSKPRLYSVAMLVPDTIVTCNHYNGTF
jgi:hypothetical protein